MNNLNTYRSSKQVAIWLLIGVAMIIIQILLGGITRLTESGLSITEWKPITGTLPPMTDAAWQLEFEKYKATDQFKYVHKYFSLAEFKFIFFWEWFHRTWARLIGLVFIVGFIYLLATKKINKKMIWPMVVLFLLGALQGVIGWIMVKSGLVPEKYFVGHVELTTHFIAALGVLCYTLWFALKLIIPAKKIIINAWVQKFLLIILVVLICQLIYGAFMAGLKAAIVAPTWPDIDGNFIPPTINDLSPWTKNLVNNPIGVQFIHRSLAYLLLILTVVWWFTTKVVTGNKLFTRLRFAILLFVLLQIVLGILTLLNATKPSLLVFLGVSHQFIAMLLLMIVTTQLYIVRKK